MKENKTTGVGVKASKSEPVISKVENSVVVLTEKEKMLELYQTLKDLGINSISDLENKIARL